MSEPTVLLCSCTGTLSPDAAAIARGTGASCSRVHHCLCRDEIGSVRAALGERRRRHRRLRPGGRRLRRPGRGARRRRPADHGRHPRPGRLVGRRDSGPEDGGADRRGAAADPARAVDRRLPRPASASSGARPRSPCRRRRGSPPRSSVTCMLTEPEEVIVPAGADDGRRRGPHPQRERARSAASPSRSTASPSCLPGGRARAFSAPRDGGRSECDIIVDLSGGRPLFPAHRQARRLSARRPGRPDRRRARAVRRGADGRHLRKAAAHPLRGLALRPRPRAAGRLHALPRPLPDRGDLARRRHGRHRPAHLRRLRRLCRGLPDRRRRDATTRRSQHLFARMRVMAEAYARAGGKAPRLLVHDEHGAEMIRLGARYGRGLPADVIPLEVRALAAFGHAELLAALALGYAAVGILPAPRTEREIDRPRDAAGRGHRRPAAGAPGRIGLVEAEDPDALSDLLYGRRPAPLARRADPAASAAGATSRASPPPRWPAARRRREPLAAARRRPLWRHPHRHGGLHALPRLRRPLPAGRARRQPRPAPRSTSARAPASSAASARRPARRTRSRWSPGSTSRPAALAPRVLNAEEPFCCIECGKPFGTKKTIDRITAKLSGVASRCSRTRTMSG